jgi:hypothetical protein
MIVEIVIDSMAPVIRPAVALEDILEHGGGNEALLARSSALRATEASLNPSSLFRLFDCLSRYVP